MPPERRQQAQRAGAVRRGIRDVDSLTSMIYLCLGGITIDLPTDRR